MILGGKKLNFKTGQKFPNGLVHGFCPKIELFLNGVFHKNSYQKRSFLILWKKKNDFKRKKLKF